MYDEKLDKSYSTNKPEIWKLVLRKILILCILSDTLLKMPPHLVIDVWYTVLSNAGSLALLNEQQIAQLKEYARKYGIEEDLFDAKLTESFAKFTATTSKELLEEYAKR